MSKGLALPKPERFGLASFAELLPAREPIIGEALARLRAFGTV